MPWTYSFDDRGFLWIRATGRLNAADLTAGRKEALADPRYGQSTRFLLDYSEVEQIDISVDTVRNLAVAPWYTPQCRRAFLVGSDLAYGMGRMYQIHAEAGKGGPVEVFRDLLSALQWLSR